MSPKHFLKFHNFSKEELTSIINRGLELKSMDKLPYSVQKKTFLLLLESFEEIGLDRINHWP